MSIENVRTYLAQFGRDQDILEFATSSATVQLAAEAAGVIPARIAKTLTFQGNDETTLLIVCAGDVKIDNSKYKSYFGHKAKMLSAEAALAATGHAVGGICPFALPTDGSVRVYTDTSIKRFETVFPAAGSSSSAIELTCDELFHYSGSLDWIDVCKPAE